VLIGVLLAVGCAKHMGARASQGAFAGLQAQSESGRPMQDVAGSMTVGGMQTLSEPEQLARLRVIVAAASTEAMARALEVATRGGQPVGGSLVETASAQAADAFTAALARALPGELAPERGALGASVTALTRAMSASAVSGALGAVIPGCDPRADPACVRRHFRLMAHDAGESLAAGVWDALGIWPLVAAFALGLVVAVLAAAVARALGRRSRHDETRGLPAPAGAHT
jgi:hypothetical protein